MPYLRIHDAYEHNLRKRTLLAHATLFTLIVLLLFKRDFFIFHVEDDEEDDKEEEWKKREKMTHVFIFYYQLLYYVNRQIFEHNVFIPFEYIQNLLTRITHSGRETGES